MTAGSSDPGQPVKKSLTAPEFSALEMASQDVPTCEMARRLGLSLHGLAALMVATRRKLGVASTQEATEVFATWPPEGGE